MSKWITGRAPIPKLHFIIYEQGISLWWHMYVMGSQVTSNSTVCTQACSCWQQQQLQIPQYWMDSHHKGWNGLPCHNVIMNLGVGANVSWIFTAYACNGCDIEISQGGLILSNACRLICSWIMASNTISLATHGLSDLIYSSPLATWSQELPHGCFLEIDINTQDIF